MTVDRLVGRSDPRPRWAHGRNHELAREREPGEILPALDAEEESLSRRVREQVPPVGLATLRDAETGETRLYDTASTAFRDQLTEAAGERVRSLERRLRRRGIDFIHIDAAGSVVDPLIAFFRMRERRTQR